MIMYDFFLTFYTMKISSWSVLKFEYLNAAWDEEYLTVGIESFKAQVSGEPFFVLILLYWFFFLVSYLQGQVWSISENANCSSICICSYWFFTSFFWLSMWYWLFSLALSSTDAWMEKLIKKKQQKKGRSTLTLESSNENLDPFEEFHRYLRQSRLRRDDCPNPIPWWGVSSFLSVVALHCINFKFSISFNI